MTCVREKHTLTIFPTLLLEFYVPIHLLGYYYLIIFLLCLFQHRSSHKNVPFCLMVFVVIEVVFHSTKDLITYFIEGRTPSRNISISFFLFITSALMEYFLEGSAPYVQLRHTTC